MTTISKVRLYVTAGLTIFYLAVAILSVAFTLEGDFVEGMLRTIPNVVIKAIALAVVIYVLCLLFLRRKKTD